MKTATHTSIQAMHKANPPQRFPLLESGIRPTTNRAPATHSIFFHPATKTPTSPKVLRQHPNHKKENRLTAQHAADMKANRELRKICADKAFVMDGARLLFLAAAIGAQGAVKATTGVELWSDPVLIALTSGVTVNALSAFLRVIHSLFPLRRSAGPQDENRKTIRQKK